MASSSLTFIDRRKLEKLFEMGSGYLLDFTNPTFTDFISDSIGIDIYDPKYAHESGSKANLLRGIWATQPEHIVKKVTADLLEYKKELGIREEERALFAECESIVSRLGSMPVDDGEHLLNQLVEKKDFAELAKLIKKAIDDGSPEAALDRLHTVTIRFFREVCAKHGIDTPPEKPLHSLVGEYVKVLKGSGIIESDMTERILRSSISVLEAYNKVRNDQSYAHDNKILNRNESRLITGHVLSILWFVNELEGNAPQADDSSDSIDWTEDLPF